MRDTCVSRRFTDPHLAWARERREILGRLDTLLRLPADQKPVDLDEQCKTLRDVEQSLLAKIQTTPALTIEGALCQIEAPDLDLVRLGLLQHETDYDCREILARLMAAGTIRRCLVEDQ